MRRIWDISEAEQDAKHELVLQASGKRDEKGKRRIVLFRRYHPTCVHREYRRMEMEKLAASHEWHMNDARAPFWKAKGAPGNACLLYTWSSVSEPRCSRVFNAWFKCEPRMASCCDPFSIKVHWHRWIFPLNRRFSLSLVILGRFDPIRLTCNECHHVLCETGIFIRKKG